MALAVAPALAATCSNQTISNTTVRQLEVTPGTCIADHVTVNAGLTVDGGAHLQLTNSTVNGGIYVQPGGELDVQATTNITGRPIPGSSTINGGIVLNNALDFDLRNSKINGVSIAGPGTGSLALTIICNLDIHGGVTLTNANQYFGGIDIGASIGGFACSGSKIDGSVTVDNIVFQALVGTNINGSLLCINSGGNKA